jgi:putative FmdB family regulatory protein
MPIYDFECRACGHRFDELVKDAEQHPPCPECAAPGAQRRFSTFAPSPKFGLRGAEAQRSADSQRSRADKRRERSDKQREQRRQGG